MFFADEAARVRGNVIGGIVADGEAVCPKCLCEEIEECAECEICGGAFAKEDLEYGCCESCFSEAAKPTLLLRYCSERGEVADTSVNFAALSLLKACGFDPNELLLAFAAETLRNPFFEQRCRFAALSSALFELDAYDLIKYYKSLSG